MKSKLFAAFLIALIVGACQDEAEILYGEVSNTTQEDMALTRSLLSDSTMNDILVPDTLSDDMRRLKETLNNISSDFAASTMAMGGSGDYDPWFNSNIYAIRELPVTISVNKVASGDSKYSYLYCSGKNQEVTLSSLDDKSSLADKNENKFYLKVLPASTGIPYLIYSSKAKTPLTIGHYNKKPNVKILMAQDNDDKLSDYASWDLISSSRYKGYFSIQNTLCMGQTNPSDPWSIFNYNLAATAEKKLGFEQPNATSLQQLFEIVPTDTFTLSSIEYDLNTKTITKSTENHYGTGQNLSSQEALVNVNFSFDATESSHFTFPNNTLHVNMYDKQVDVPLIIGEGILLPGSDSYQTPMKAPFPYSNRYSTLRRILYTKKLNCPGRHNIKVLASFVKYDISINFTAKAYYKNMVNNVEDMRIVTIAGIWRGTLFEDPTEIEPVRKETTFTRIDGGGPDEPILRLLPSNPQSTK